MAVAQARRQVTDPIGARGALFISGATEENNLALRGVADWVKTGLTIKFRTEHKVVLDVYKTLDDRALAILCWSC